MLLTASIGNFAPGLVPAGTCTLIDRPTRVSARSPSSAFYQRTVFALRGGGRGRDLRDICNQVFKDLRRQVATERRRKLNALSGRDRRIDGPLVCSNRLGEPEPEIVYTVFVW